MSAVYKKRFQVTQWGFFLFFIRRSHFWIFFYTLFFQKSWEINLQKIYNLVNKKFKIQLLATIAIFESDFFISRPFHELCYIQFAIRDCLCFWCKGKIKFHRKRYSKVNEKKNFLDQKTALQYTRIEQKLLFSTISWTFGKIKLVYILI